MEKYKEIYERYKSCGLTVEQFCSNEGIVRSRFYYWKRKHKKLPNQSVSMVKDHDRAIVRNPKQDNSSQNSAGFIPVWIASGTGDPVKSGKRSGEKVESSVSSERNTYLEVSYQNGTTVRLAGERDLELVKTLILLSR